MTSIFKIKSLIIKIIVLFFIFFTPCFTIAQSTNDTVISRKIKSLPEIFKKKDTLLLKPIKNNFFFAIPLIGSQPATGLLSEQLDNIHLKVKIRRIDIQL
jgi:hypothetical protein